MGPVPMIKKNTSRNYMKTRRGQKKKMFQKKEPFERKAIPPLPSGKSQGGKRGKVVPDSPSPTTTRKEHCGSGQTRKGGEPGKP